MSDTRLPNALVVDDDITGRGFLRALLKRAGYTVEAAASGEAALKMFRPGLFDVVFAAARSSPRHAVRRRRNRS